MPVLMLTLVLWYWARLTMLTLCIMMMTPVLQCWPLYYDVHPSITMLTPVLWCSPQYYNADPSITMLTPVLWCWPLCYDADPRWQTKVPWVVVLHCVATSRCPAALQIAVVMDLCAVSTLLGLSKYQPSLPSDCSGQKCSYRCTARVLCSKCEQ